jgi:hypothetical protein
MLESELHTAINMDDCRCSSVSLTRTTMFASIKTFRPQPSNRTGARRESKALKLPGFNERQSISGAALVELR